MDIDVTALLAQIAFGVEQFITHSFIFSALKFFLFVYSAVLFLDIILVLMIRGLFTDFKIAMYGANRPLVSKSILIKRWEAILHRLESDSPSQYKAAILETDALADEILVDIGYHGETMTERLASVKGGQLETKDLLAAAHEVRNRIVQDQDFTLSQDEAKKIVHDFKVFFDEVELF